MTSRKYTLFPSSRHLTVRSRIDYDSRVVGRPTLAHTLARTLVMTLEFAPRPRPATLLISGLALILGLGWASREIAWALEPAKAVSSQTIVLDGVDMKD